MPQNSKYLKFIIVFGLTFFLYGCNSIMRGNVVTFYEGPLPSGETIRIQASDPEKVKSLEFRRYSQLISQQLENIGYIVVNDQTESTDLIAMVNYSITVLPSEIRMERRHPYVYYHFGYQNYYDPYYFGFNYRWNERIYSTASYLRRLELNIVNSNEEQERVFEGRVESTGIQSQLPEIMPYMVTAMFSNFPGESGVTKVVSIEMDE